jgi:hypothetical protein
MFLRQKIRKKDGKLHRSWSVVESRRASGGRVLQRQLLHLGELNDAQHAGWVRAIDAIDGAGQSRQLALFPADRECLPLAYEVFDGNTTEQCTLEVFLKRIENRYGKVRRTWLMERGIPTEATVLSP